MCLPLGYHQHTDRTPKTKPRRTQQCRFISLLKVQPAGPVWDALLGAEAGEVPEVPDEGLLRDGLRDPGQPQGRRTLQAETGRGA